MRKKSWKKRLAIVLGAILAIQAPLGMASSCEQVYAYTERAATVNASSLNVRTGAGTTYSSAGKLSKGTAIRVINEVTATDGKLWYQIRYTTSGGASATGYVLSTYVKFPATYEYTADFETQLNTQGFPESYKEALRQLHAQYPNWIFEAQHTNLDWNTVIQNESVLGRNLVHKNSISSYKSIVDGAYNWDNSSWTGFDGASWVAASEDILKYYMDPRNFLDEVYVFQFLSQEYDLSLHTSEGLATMLKGTFMANTTISGSSSNGSTSDGPGGSSASGAVSSGGPGVNGSSGVSSGSGAVSSDGPGAGSTSNDNASNNNSSDTQNGGVKLNQPPSSEHNGDDGVRLQAPSLSMSKHDTALVSATVVSSGPGASISRNPSASQSPVSTGNVSYVDAIMNAAEQSGVNPYVLAAMILQEQGRNGTGNSISGNYAGYVGYYNYFNVGAYASDGMSAVQRGLWYASQSGNYGRPWNTQEKSIIGGATFYGTNYVSAGQDTLYLKKYNVQGTNKYKHQYMTNVDGAASEGAIFAEGFSEELKQTHLVFKIPVYTNMPETPCQKPTLDGSPNNKLYGLGVDGFVLTPTFHKDTTSYDLIVDHSVSSVNVAAYAIDSKAKVRGNGTVSLQSGNNEISIVVTAENGTERTYTIHVVRQTDGPTYTAGVGGSSASGTQTSSGNAISSYGPGAAIGGSSSTTSGNQISSGGPGVLNSQTSSDGNTGSTESDQIGPGATSQGPSNSSSSGSSISNEGPGGSNITIVQ